MPVFSDPIPGVIPFGTITTFAGAPLLGKSAMLASWCARWRDGRTICGHATNRPTTIAVLAGDRGWASSAEWFRRAGFPDIRHHSLRDDLTTDWRGFLTRWPQLQAMFAAQVDQLNLPPGSLLIVDPLMLWIPGNPNDVKFVMVGLGLIDQVIRARQLTVIAVQHQGKQKTGAEHRYLRPQERILGSVGFLGFSDTTIFMMGPEDLGAGKTPAPYYGLTWIPHLNPPETFLFTRDEQGLFIPYHEIGAVGATQVPAEALTPILPDQLATFLSLIPDCTPPILSKELVRAAHRLLGISRATTFRYLQQAELDGLIVRMGDGWQRIPAGEPS